MDRMQQQATSYNRDETADILDLASELEDRSAAGEIDLSRSDLYRIAEEMNISPEAIDQAIRSLARARRTDAKEVKRSIKRRMRFVRHAMAYVITVSALAVVDALGGGGWWFFYVAGFWGILLALHALRFVTRRNGPLERRLYDPEP
ncbi:MAG: 2TM domain-containing protein [Acidimicrobiia bacterium]